MNISADKKPASVSRFVRIGGSYQPIIKSSADFGPLLELDDALWEVTSLSTSALRTDKRFLDFLDSDKNQLIRTDEVRTALKFLRSVFTDLSGVDNASDVIELAKLNCENPDGAEIHAAARTMLLALGKAGADSITLSEIINDADVKKCTMRNGDGVVAASEGDTSDVAELIRLATQTVGTICDLSGECGINAAKLAEFIDLKTKYLAWLDDGALRAEEINPFGEATSDIYALFCELKDPVGHFYLSSSALSFFENDPERIAKRDITADLRSADEVSKLLSGTAIAAPEKDGVLSLDKPLNPAWKDKFLKLVTSEFFAPYLSGSRITCESWMKFSALFSARTAYLAADPGSAKFAGVDTEFLKRITSEENVAILEKLIQDDIEAGCALAGCSKLLKACIYQRYMLEFLNNFANLTELFDLNKFSMLQTGTLVMDGRHFTLAVPVANIAEHKKIVKSSNICVAYVEVVHGNPPVKTMLAVAITNGSMQNLFVGKRGIFYAADGKVCDARVTDFIEQPVSIPDALKKPFLSLGEFVGKQVDKLVSVQSGNVQKELGAKLSGAKTPAPAAGNNGTMLLMSGSIGIAAIGSSVAFIAKSLQNVSLLTVLGVILGIVLVFGGPGVVIALVKLCKRDLARFLEAAGCALNHKMRLTFKLGLFFTFTPLRPGSVEEEIFDGRVNKKTLSNPLSISLAVITALICGAAGYYIGKQAYNWYNSKQTVQERQVKVAKPAAAPAKAPVRK